MRRIISVSGIEELSGCVAKTVVEQARICLEKTGRFTWVLSGGNTPKFIFFELISNYSSEVDWSKIDVFWVDERCVPHSHEDSNYGMAYDYMLSKVKFKNVYRMEGELPPSDAADNYERQIRSYFGLSEGELPSFDFMLLGVGVDGHVASLFSLEEVENSNSRLVVAPFVEKLGTYRITMTLPVINNSSYSLVMVLGKEKSQIVKEAWAGNLELPIGQVNLTHGSELWLTDHEL